MSVMELLGTQLLECSICASTFDQNKHVAHSLGCGHTICAGCIIQLVRMSMQFTIDCPICRTRLALNEAHDVGFPKNYAIMNMVSELENQRYLSHGWRPDETPAVPLPSAPIDATDPRVLRPPFFRVPQQFAARQILRNPFTVILDPALAPPAPAPEAPAPPVPAQLNNRNRHLPPPIPVQLNLLVPVVAEMNHHRQGEIELLVRAPYGNINVNNQAQLLIGFPIDLREEDV